MKPGPILQQLSAFCRRSQSTRKYVFVPNRQVGYNLGNALALAGCNWVNLELITPIDHARARVGPQLVAEGLRSVADDALLLLVERVLDEILVEMPGSYFEAVPRSGGLARAFRGTLKSLRLSGVRPEEVSTRLTGPKGAFVAAAYRRYVERLTEARYFDDALVFDRALALPPLPSNARAQFAVLDETPLPGLAGRYVEEVTGRELVRLGIAGIDVPAPPHAAAVRFRTASYVREINAPESEVALQTCIGSETEVREVLRQILDAGLPLDSVEIAYTSEEPYLSRLVDLADRFELPFAYSAGIPAMLTRPGQAVAGFLQWIAGGYSSRDLVALARGGHLDPILPRTGERALRGYELARQIRMSRIGRGRDQYLTQLRNRNSDAAAERGVLALSIEAMEALLAVAGDDASSSMTGATKAASEFLERFARVSIERDKVAIQSLQDRLRQVIESDLSAAGSDGRAAERLRDLLCEHKIEASTAHPGKAYVVPLNRAGYAGREHLFIVGLDEASFPGAPVEDPVLLDDERSLLSPALDLLRSGPGEKVWQMHRALRSGASRVTLHSQRHALHESREVYPSAFFQRMAESREPVRLALVPSCERALDRTEGYLGLEPTEQIRERLESEFAALALGYASADVRSGHGFTPFHGSIGFALPPELIPGRTQPTSVSVLERLATCPYKFFLRDVLKVRPPDDPGDDPSIWLTAAELGNVLHSVFHRFMATLAERSERPRVEVHANLLFQMLDHAIAEAERAVPVHNQAAHKADVVRMHRAAGVFLADEARREAEPYAFEFSFGDGRADGPNRPEPVEVRLSDRLTLRLRGRIDRIDRTASGFEIWDYKSGSPDRFDEHDLLGGGLNLQWALYAHALDAVLADQNEAQRTSRSGYFFVGDRGHGLRFGDAPPAPGHLAAILEPLLAMAEHGAFLHVQRKSSCRYCDFAGVCEAEAVTCKSINDDLKKDPERIPADLAYRDALLSWIGGTE